MISRCDGFIRHNVRLIYWTRTKHWIRPVRTLLRRCTTLALPPGKTKETLVLVWIRHGTVKQAFCYPGTSLMRRCQDSMMLDEDIRAVAMEVLI